VLNKLKKLVPNRPKPTAKIVVTSAAGLGVIAIAGIAFARFNVRNINFSDDDEQAVLHEGVSAVSETRGQLRDAEFAGA
jgi:D-arabinose 1-dehydrogenase-like Zn-dependent alcohol dehydrogenase